METDTSRKTKGGQHGLVQHLVQRGAITKSPRVAEVMRVVDRRHFVAPGTPPGVVYDDRPLPIGMGQTISAPHMHAVALDLLADKLQPGARVLDVGSGSGYLVACFSRMVGPNGYVLGIEKVPDLAARSVGAIERSEADPAPAEGGLGQPAKWTVVHANALERALDKESAFDAIHVGAAADEMPQVLVDKLAPGGKMVVPVGPRWASQELTFVERSADGSKVTQRSVLDVAYVPLVRPGEYEDHFSH